MKEWSRPKVEVLDIVLTELSNNEAGGTKDNGQGNPNGTGNGGNGNNFGWIS